MKDERVFAKMTKMYSILLEGENNIKKAKEMEVKVKKKKKLKGVKECVVKKQIKHEQFKEAICGRLPARPAGTIPKFTREGGFFAFKPKAGLQYFPEGLEVTALSLMTSAGFLSVRLVTSLFRRETTSGSLLTHAVDLLLSGGRISTPD